MRNASQSHSISNLLFWILYNSLFKKNDGKTDPEFQKTKNVAGKPPLLPLSRKRKRPLPSLIPLSPFPGIIPLNSIPHNQLSAIPIIETGPTCSIVELQDYQPVEKISMIDNQCQFDTDDDDPADNQKNENEIDTLVINFDETSNKTPKKKPKSKNTIYNCTICQPNVFFKIW